MTTTYTLDQELHCSTSGKFSLPEGKTWADVQSHYIKWDDIHVEIDGNWHEIPLESDSDVDIDWKRPARYDLHVNDDTGCVESQILSSD